MKRFLLILSFLFFCNNSQAGMEGYGELKMNDIVLKYFKEYLGTKGHGGDDGGFTKHGRGWNFFVSVSGEMFGYTYCQQGQTCVMNPAPARNICHKLVKEYLQRKEKCFQFAKQRTIIWDGNKIKIPIGASSDEIEGTLRRNNWID